MELLKLLSTNEIVAQVACFLILLVLLRAFLWKNILKVLDDRRAKIASDLHAIETSKADLEGLKNAYNARLAAADDEGRARIQEAVKEGRRIADEIRKAAQADSEKTMQGALENVRMELARAKEDLKETIVDLTIRVAEQVVQEKLDEPEDKKLIERFIKEMETKK